MKSLLLSTITLYQKFISPLFLVMFGHACKYKVTCSHYTKNMIKKYGPIRGLGLGARRVISCV